MKILITYASAGTGHFKAAQAVYKYLKENHREVDAKIIDVLENTNAIFRIGYTSGYFFLARYAPLVWSWAFWVTRNKTLCPVTRFIAATINRLSTEGFAKLLIQEQCDVVISTHFLPSEITAYLKRKHKISSRLITVLTDFGVHPFWVSAGTDIYIVPASLTSELLVLEGVKKDIIRELGIPIDQKFSKTYDKAALCRKFGLQEGKPTVLVVTGSFGLGPIAGIVDLLYKEAQVLVVCARNKRLYARLKNKGYEGVKVFEFVDNIEELMAVSEVIITKPGGLSIAESLSMDLAQIFITPIPGQEVQNLEILSGYGIGLQARDASFIEGIVLDIRFRCDKLKGIRENMRKLKKPYAAQELSDAICQGSIWSTH